MICREMQWKENRTHAHNDNIMKQDADENALQLIWTHPDPKYPCTGTAEVYHNPETGHQSFPKAMIGQLSREPTERAVHPPPIIHCGHD